MASGLFQGGGFNLPASHSSHYLSENTRDPVLHVSRSVSHSSRRSQDGAAEEDISREFRHIKELLSLAGQGTTPNGFAQHAFPRGFRANVSHAQVYRELDMLKSHVLKKIDEQSLLDSEVQHVDHDSDSGLDSEPKGHTSLSEERFSRLGGLLREYKTSLDDARQQIKLLESSLAAQSHRLQTTDADTWQESETFPSEKQPEQLQKLNDAIADHEETSDKQRLEIAALQGANESLRDSQSQELVVRDHEIERLQKLQTEAETASKSYLQQLKERTTQINEMSLSHNEKIDTLRQRLHESDRKSVEKFNDELHAQRTTHRQEVTNLNARISEIQSTKEETQRGHEATLKRLRNGHNEAMKKTKERVNDEIMSHMQTRENLHIKAQELSSRADDYENEMSRISKSHKEEIEELKQSHEMKLEILHQESERNRNNLEKEWQEKLLAVHNHNETSLAEMRQSHEQKLETLRNSHDNQLSTIETKAKENLQHAMGKHQEAASRLEEKITATQKQNETSIAELKQSHQQRLQNHTKSHEEHISKIRDEAKKSLDDVTKAHKDSDARTRDEIEHQNEQRREAHIRELEKLQSEHTQELDEMDNSWHKKHQDLSTNADTERKDLQKQLDTLQGELKSSVETSDELRQKHAEHADELRKTMDDNIAQLRQTHEKDLSDERSNSERVLEEQKTALSASLTAEHGRAHQKKLDEVYQTNEKYMSQREERIRASLSEQHKNETERLKDSHKASHAERERMVESARNESDQSHDAHLTQLRREHGTLTAQYEQKLCQVQAELRRSKDEIKSLEEKLKESFENTEKVRGEAEKARTTEINERSRKLKEAISSGIELEKQLKSNREEMSCIQTTLDGQFQERITAEKRCSMLADEVSGLKSRLISYNPHTNHVEQSPTKDDSKAAPFEDSNPSAEKSREPKTSLTEEYEDKLRKVVKQKANLETDLMASYSSELATAKAELIEQFNDAVKVYEDQHAGGSGQAPEKHFKQLERAESTLSENRRLRTMRSINEIMQPSTEVQDLVKEYDERVSKLVKSGKYEITHDLAIKPDRFESITKATAERLKNEKPINAHKPPQTPSPQSKQKSRVSTDSTPLISASKNDSTELSPGKLPQRAVAVDSKDGSPRVIDFGALQQPFPSLSAAKPLRRDHALQSNETAGFNQAFMQHRKRSRERAEQRFHRPKASGSQELDPGPTSSKARPESSSQNKTFQTRDENGMPITRPYRELDQRLPSQHIASQCEKPHARSRTRHSRGHSLAERQSKALNTTEFQAGALSVK